jgi:YidC/Oxa1 family membrane protein insertase
VFSQKVFKETGLSIIAISIVISVLCLPVYIVAENWQKKERDIQKKLKRKIDKIKGVFKGDEQYMMLSTFYRQNKYHPIYAMRSTFGLLIQIPFFIAAYTYLSHLDALQGAHFLFIKNLGAPDALLNIGSIKLNLLPILMTAINCVSGAIYTRGFPVKDKIQLYGMAAIFLVLLYNSPSGLLVYWTMNNIFSLAKNCYYKIKSPYKSTVMCMLVSAAFIFMIWFILGVHHGNINIRWPIAVLSFVAALLPWALRLIKKYFLKKEIIKLTGKERSVIFILSCLCFFALSGLVVPILLISSSPSEFSFVDTYKSPLFFIFNTALQTFGFFVVWPLFLYALFPDKIKKIMSVCFLIMTLSAICNVFLFPAKYGLISVTLEFFGKVSHNLADIVFNFFVLFIIALVVLFLLYKHLAKIIIPVLSICSAVFLTMSVLNIVNAQNVYLKTTKYYKDENKTINKIEPIFHLSKTGNNVVVIMLDRAISPFMHYIFKESPDLNNKYSGFVFYPNTVSFNGYTRIGAPPIFGGYDAAPKEINKRTNVTLQKKHNEALLMMPDLFSNAGYSVVATDSPYANYTSPPDMSIYDDMPNVKGYITDSVYTDMWIKEHNFNLPSVSSILKRSIFWYSLLRISPYILREAIYLNGNWCAPIENNSLRLTLNGYSVLDYLPRLTDFNTDYDNTTVLFVNNTTHEGSFLQAPDYRPAIFVTNYGESPFKKEKAYHINAASIKRLSDWFEYLKENDVYDNTRIIIVSDHGPEPNFVTKLGLPFNADQFNPLLMVKDFNASGPIKTDNSFMSNADVPSFALRDIITNPVNPYTGKAINMDAKQKPLYIAMSASIHLGKGNNTQITFDPKKDYYVHDNIFDPKNWTKAN